MRVLVALLVILSGSCFAREANQKFALRVSEIDHQYQDGVDEIDSFYATNYDRIMKLQREALIETDPRNKTEPLRSVTEDAELKTISAACSSLSNEIDELKESGVYTGAADKTLKECFERWNNMHVRLLVTTYWAADVDWILRTLKSDPDAIKVEPLFVYSHNMRVRAYAEKQLVALNASRMVARRELEDRRQAGMQQATIDRDEEIAANKRRFAAVMAAAAQGMSRANQRATYAPQYSTTVSPTGCSSDFSCGIGHRCVKANYSGTGYCAKAVNEYGVQTFDLPSMESVLVKVPKGSDCKLISDCPVGFQCDLGSGVCLR